MTATPDATSPTNSPAGIVVSDACSADRPRNELICDTPKCRWGGDYDDLLISRWNEDGEVVECSDDDPDSRPCCPKCLLDNLIETEGWDDDQLPGEAFKQNTSSAGTADTGTENL